MIWLSQKTKFYPIEIQLLRRRRPPPPPPPPASITTTTVNTISALTHLTSLL